ncbi:hypothetical protein [Cohnella sp.]|uniref:hypothetical protein n=1 Tax=Cohnella sp. TaxID=1883426 RepID=UPI003704468C
MAARRKTEFEILAVEKAKLWQEIKGKRNYKETEQHKRIKEIDARLWELVKS